MPGPPPRRSDARRRRNDPAAGPPEKVDLELVDDEGVGSLPWMVKQPIVIPETPKVATEDDGVDEEPSEAWHPIAVQFWEAIKHSGQSLFYEPTDWMTAYLICESISRDMKPQVVGIIQATDSQPGEVIRERIPLKGASLGAYLKAFGQLMFTEGERRRLALELERTRSRAQLGVPAAEEKITDRRVARLTIAKRSG